MQKKLRIAQVAPLWFPVPPDGYGGTEWIVSLLTEGLVERGHNVTLFAAVNSKTKARLVPMYPRGLIESRVPRIDVFGNLHALSTAFERAEEFDIPHSHTAIWTPLFERFVRTPVVQTMHNIPPQSDWRWNILQDYTNSGAAVFVSERERQNSLVRFRNSHVIYNALDISAYPFSPVPEDHFVWMGRLCQAKGSARAAEAARRAGVKLKIAGPVQELHREYFIREVEPLLSPDIEYVGEYRIERFLVFSDQRRPSSIRWNGRSRSALS